jgi:alkylated DNA repair dioxygenase AlkB
MDFLSAYCMSTLFNVAPAFPEGFSYFPGFISEEEEEELYRAIAGLTLHPFNFHGYEGKRKVASFGYDYDFSKKTLNRGKDIPPAFTFLIERVAVHTGIAREQFAELLVTEYPPASVINWHRDAPPFDLVAGISLTGDCIFRLKPYEQHRQRRNAIIDVAVQRRSLYILQGEVRTNWQHSTMPVKTTRHSITLRTLKQLP